MQRLGADELVARLALPAEVDALVDDPVVLVDCGPATDGIDLDLLAARLEGVPAVFLGVGDGRLAGAFDAAGDDEVVTRLAATVATHPMAATSLAVLLRAGPARSIAEGLVAESATYALLQAGPEHTRWLGSRRAPAGPSDDPAPVDLAREGDELHITLQRPGKRNAFSSAMRDGLFEGLAVAAVDPTLRVIIDGAGPSFCSGGDLGEFGTTPDPATAHLVRLRRSVGSAIAAIADRVTVTVHGACVGAGVELPAFAHRVVAREDATFWLPEVAMGLVPGAGGTVSIPRRIGRQRTALLALGGAPIDAPTALEWGLVDAIE